MWVGLISAFRIVTCYFSSRFCGGNRVFYLFCVDEKDAFKEQRQGSEMVIWSQMGDGVEGVLVIR